MSDTTSQNYPVFRVFIASPTDVAQERQRVWDVISRLNGEYQDEFHLHPIAYEKEHTYSADHPQEQIEQAAHSDIVIGIFWARAGTRLDLQRHRRPDGTAYESGSIYEIETALDHYEKHGRPHVVLFLKDGDPPMLRGDKGREQVKQREELDKVIKRWVNPQDGEIKRGYNSFSTSSQFEEQVEKHLRKWLAEHDFGTDAPVWRTGKDGSPFPGLAPYDAQYRRVFFGRDTAVRRCSEKLRDANDRGCAFLLIVGASGSGKSSLAQAGLIPRLAVPGSAPGVNIWRTALMRPGTTPLLTLASTLFTAAPERRIAGDPASWAKRVADNPAFAAISLAEALAGERLLLLIDQLEEAFIAPSDAFAQAVGELARSGKAWIIATLRSDRYASLQADETLLALKRDGDDFDLAVPGRAEFDAMIRRPVQAAGLRFERRKADGQDLGELLLEALGGADALPLLQMTLAELFAARDERTGTLTFAAYDAIGGLEGAISRHADAALEKLDEGARQELRPLLLELTTAGPDGQHLARPVRRAVLETSLARQRLVKTLEDARLLVAGRQDELRLAHEALLRNWQAAREILENEGLFIRVRDRLGPLARDWSTAGRMREHLLQPGRLLSDAEAVLPQLREASDSETVVAFVEASLAQREQARALATKRLAGDHEKILGLLSTGEFDRAEIELNGVVGYLTDQTDTDLAERRAEYEARRQRVHRLAAFYTHAREVYSRAGEEDFGAAPGECEQALKAIGVFDGAEWWKHLPTEDLDRDQVEHLKQETYRQLLLFSGLELVPGIASLFPRAEADPARPRPAFDPRKLMRFVPDFLLSAIIGAGGFGSYRLPGKQDNPQALTAFRKSSDMLSQVREFEEMRAAEKGEIWRPSRTSQLVGQIAEVLKEFASGPKGASIDYRQWLRSPGSRGDTEPVNAADYFFIGLFNYFIAKRSDALLVKVIGLLQGRFADLKARSPYAAAERLLRAATSIEPENYWPHWVLGRTLLGRGDFAGAELAFNAAVALQPSYARGYEQRALAVGHQSVRTSDENLLRRALADSERAMKEADGDPSVFWPRGELFELFGQTTEALDSYSRWLELEDNILQTISRSAGVARLRDLASRLARRTESTDPAARALRADAYGLLALVHLTQRNLAEALEAADDGLRVNPRHAHALTVKGVLLREKGELVQAIELLSLALEEDPVNYLAALNRARASEQIAADKRALDAWRELPDRSGRETYQRCPRWMLSEATAAEARIRASLQ